MHKRWALITSNEIRHRYVANMVSRSPHLVAVVSEAKRSHPSQRFTNEAEQAYLAKYFADRMVSEASVLHEGTSWNLHHRQELIIVEPGQINSEVTTQRLREAGVEWCLVYGSSWLKEPWLSAFPNRMVNLHLGLSPYYRGAGTNFWALAEGKPEYVGGTIHLIDEGLDTGPILFHVRPAPEVEDDPHRFFNKLIRKAGIALLENLPHLHEMKAAPQWHVTDREYKMKDFNAQALRQMLEHCEQGMLSRYAQEAGQRASRVRLVSEFLPFS